MPATTLSTNIGASGSFGNSQKQRGSPGQHSCLAGTLTSPKALDLEFHIIPQWIVLVLGHINGREVVMILDREQRSEPRVILPLTSFIVEEIHALAAHNRIVSCKLMVSYRP